MTSLPNLAPCLAPQLPLMQLQLQLMLRLCWQDRPASAAREPGPCVGLARHAVPLHAVLLHALHSVSSVVA